LLLLSGDAHRWVPLLAVHADAPPGDRGRRVTVSEIQRS
jgi:hypothetical protein